MPLATRDGLLGQHDGLQKVFVDDTRHVFVRPLRANEFNRLRKELASDNGDIDEDRFIAHIMQACVVDESANQIFSPDDIDAIESMDNGPYCVLLDAVMRQNPILLRDTGEAEDAVAETEKNSETTPQNGSPTGSQ